MITESTKLHGSPQNVNMAQMAGYKTLNLHKIQYIEEDLLNRSAINGTQKKNKKLAILLQC